MGLTCCGRCLLPSIARALVQRQTQGEQRRGDPWGHRSRRQLSGRTAGSQGAQAGGGDGEGESGAGARVMRWEDETGRENRLLRHPGHWEKSSLDAWELWIFYLFFFHQGKKVPYPVSEHSTVLHFAAIYASMCFQLVTSLFKTD